MEREARYPDYIGISDVSTKSFEHMRVEGYLGGQPSIMFDEPRASISTARSTFREIT